MTLDLYYIHESHPCRAVMLCARALGLELNLISVDLFKGGSRTPEFLKMNPAHSVPVLKDGDFVLSEGRAIICYLVNKYAKDDSLYPKDPQKRARVDQMLYFDISNLYFKLTSYYVPVLLQYGTLEDSKLEQLDEAFQIFDKFLEGREFAAGNQLTIADFGIIPGVAAADIVLEIDLSKYENVFRWYNKCKQTIKGYKEINEVGCINFKAMFDSLKKK